jgi:hypothetical protein
VTDVPRRAYPLVVPPPGGFEEAVTRGRRIRRRRAGGSTGAALVLVGALAYSLTGSDGGTRELHPTTGVPRVETTQAPYAGPTASPEPTAQPTDTGRTQAGGPVYNDPGTGGGEPPVGVPSAGPSLSPPGPKASERFAERPAIKVQGPTALAATDTGCLSASTSSSMWCAVADAQFDQQLSTYRLSYMLCRPVDAGDGEVHFSRTQQVDFAVTATKGDANPANDETYWTYSAGQPVVAENETVELQAGYCLEWYTHWDGWDDYGYDPGEGRNKLSARSLGNSPDGPLPPDSIEFDHE